MTRVKGEITNGLRAGQIARLGTMEGMCFSAPRRGGGSQREGMQGWEL